MEFRDIVAKKLGLEVQTLNLADYEILTRIEQSLRPTYLHTYSISTENFAKARASPCQCSCMVNTAN